ncbi:MAG: extensin family protein [Sphingomonas sp.]
MPRWIVLLLALPLGACLSGSDHSAPPQRSPLARPTEWRAPATAETRACLADLDTLGIAYSPLADQDYGGGCAVTGAVQLIDVGVPVTGLKAMRCGLARAFAGWVRNAVAPAARQMLGSDLVRVETYGTYACRATIGTAGPATRLSGHASANAVDVAGFILADGRRVTVLADWTSADPATHDFLRVIRASACKRFGTVLSPDYNAAHRNHFHLEDDHAGFCR